MKKHCNLLECYNAYISKVIEIESQASVFDGLFGMNNEVKNHPTHTEFFNEVPILANDVVEHGTYSDILSSVETILFSAADHRQEASYWYLYAAQQHVHPLLKRIKKEDAAAFLARYEKCYPKIDRMPAQEKVAKALKRKAK